MDEEEHPDEEVNSNESNPTDQEIGDSGEVKEFEPSSDTSEATDVKIESDAPANESEDIPLITETPNPFEETKSDESNEENIPTDSTLVKPDAEKIYTPNWEILTLPADVGFSQVDEVFFKPLLEDDRYFHPIISRLFQSILKKCEDGFTFQIERTPYEEYYKFYQEINRIQPSLKQKIKTDDCLGSVYFIGDTHGSIEDTYLILKFLINVFREDSSAKVIFVGDYVDRNPWDLQNLTLIIAFYFLYPGRVVLLRGNHEDRIINQYYGFIDNLLRRFYEKGEELYELIINFFMTLPLIHVSQMFKPDSQIGARVISAHGGIPIDARDFTNPILLESLEEKLICEVDKSDDMDNLSVSILWGDPDEMIQQIVTDNQGSGRMRFGSAVFGQFMAANHLDVMVRGHQKWKEGYRVFFNHRLYSIFSTSKYDDRKKFDPKILLLSIGHPPNIIPIDEHQFAEELKKFK